jgi:cytoskeletal protein CcmA (bactofilin family)
MAAGLLLVQVLALSIAEDGKLPDEGRLSYQTAFPQNGKFRMPTFMDVFAAFSQTEYIKVGLKWDVAESKAAMAYATRLSSGHKPIKEQTDDYHIEAFSKTEKSGGDPLDFTKMRFRQKGAYSGSVGYHLPDPLKPGVFQLWDNKAKALAKLKLGDLDVQGKAEVKGDLTFHGKLIGDVSIVTGKDSEFAGSFVGKTEIGGRFQAPPAVGLGLYTTVKGATYDPKSPRMYITDAGAVGIGLTKPTAGLHVKAANTAFRVDDGKMSVSDQSVVEIDGTYKGQVTAGKRFIVLQNGNVGVNNNAPTEKLHVAGGTLKVDSADADIKDKATVFITNTIASTACDTHSLRVRDHFYVSTCGRVGVKTPSPLADFHVTGETKTDFLTVDKDATITGTFTTNKFAPLKSHFEADTVKVTKTTTLVGKVQMDSDVVIKGNLFVQKEVKMIGGSAGGEEDEMSQMMESRLALLEESHKSLQEWHKNLLDSHEQLKKDNHALRTRVKHLEGKQ